MTARVTLAAAVTLVLAVAAGCGREDLSPEAARGRQVYQSQCIACHNSDPAQAGPLGPAVKASSRELLEAKVLRGSYPPGYTPKRPSAVMQPMPQLADAIPSLSEYLK
jgi:mono/diheme cytochrome c family protein